MRLVYLLNMLSALNKDIIIIIIITVCNLKMCTVNPICIFLQNNKQANLFQLIT